MRLLTLAAAFAFATDQVSKYAVVYGLGLAEMGRIEVFPPYLVFIDSLNTGINFGLFSGLPAAAQWIKIGLALAICAAIVWLGARYFHRRIEYLCAGILIGGAMGNVLDRVLFGGVIDFLNMSCCGIHNPYVFNVADIWVVAGAVGLAIFAGRGPTVSHGK